VYRSGGSTMCESAEMSLELVITLSFPIRIGARARAP
jgi:hypothetical protein